MKRLNNQFGWLAFLLFIFGGFLFFFISKGDIVLLINTNHNKLLGILMKYWTHLGDGLALVPLLIGMLLYRYYYAIGVIILSFFILLFSQGLKQTIFKGWERPTAYFDQQIQWNKVEGVEINTKNTFPSGHTITGFGIMFYLALAINRRWWYILCFLLASGVGLSRIYLLQHFYIDVYFGAILGMLASLVSLEIMDRIFSKSKKDKLLNSSILFRKSV